MPTKYTTYKFKSSNSIRSMHFSGENGNNNKTRKSRKITSFFYDLVITMILIFYSLFVILPFGATIQIPYQFYCRLTGLNGRIFKTYSLENVADTIVSFVL